MGDEDLNVAPEDVGGGGETPEAPGGGKRTGFLPGVVITILKYAAIALGIIILVATTTLITFNIVNGRKTTEPAIGTRELYASGRPELTYYELGQVRGSTADEVMTIFSGGVYIGYDGEKKEIADDLVKRQRQISNTITIWLAKKTYQELRPDRLEQIQESLVVVVNGVLSKGKVQEVLLDGFQVVR